MQLLRIGTGDVELPDIILDVVFEISAVGWHSHSLLCHPDCGQRALVFQYYSSAAMSGSACLDLWTTTMGVRKILEASEMFSYGPYVSVKAWQWQLGNQVG